MVARFTKIALDYAQFIIAPTDKVKALLLDYGVNKEIFVVPTGIDLRKFEMPCDPAKLNQLRERIGIPHQSKVAIMVGRLAKEKNMEEIISFISRLGNPNITLLIVGDGPHRARLEQYARQSNAAARIVFTGMVKPDEIADYYRLGDVFVSASSSEAQGLTYIEALAAGIPALCRKDPCLDSVIEDGINGWQYSSYAQFSDRLEAMLYQDWLHKKLSKNARAKAMREYSSIMFANKVSEIYEKSLCCGLLSQESV